MFSKRCVTRGWTIAAESVDDALAKAESCINDDGELDENKIEKVGLKMESWDTVEGDSDWEVVNVETVEV
jgi:hypothetical protein